MGTVDAFLARFSLNMGYMGSDIYNIATSGLAATIYPNPTSNHLDLQVQLVKEEAIRLKVYSTSGQLVKHKYISSAGIVINYSLDVEDLSNGIYLIQIETESSVITKRFIKI